MPLAPVSTILSPEPTLSRAHRHRCSLTTAFDTESIAFTHLPKAGGGSFQQLLISAAKAAHKRVLNAYCYAYDRDGWPCHTP